MRNVGAMNDSLHLDCALHEDALDPLQEPLGLPCRRLARHSEASRRRADTLVSFAGTRPGALAKFVRSLPQPSSSCSSKSAANPVLSCLCSWARLILKNLCIVDHSGFLISLICVSKLSVPIHQTFVQPLLRAVSKVAAPLSNEVCLFGGVGWSIGRSFKLRGRKHLACAMWSLPVFVSHSSVLGLVKSGLVWFGLVSDLAFLRL